MQDIKKDFRLFAHDKHISTTKLWGHEQYIKDSYINPAVIEERQNNAISIDVYSRLMMDNILMFTAEVTDDICGIICAQLLFMENNNPEQDIKMYINSPGGSVSAGLSVIDVMNIISTDVSTTCMGTAASMGAMLLTSGAKGKRYSLPHSRILIHQPLGGAQGQASDIEIAAREIVKTKKELYDILSETTGQPYEKIAADADRDYWMNAEEAKNYGIIDNIISIKK